MSTLQNTDLFPVHRGASTYKVSYADIVAGVKIPGVMEYMGVANPANPVPAPTGGLKAGMVYALSPAGTAHASWTGIGAVAVLDGQLAVWEGAKWELMGVSSLHQPDASEAVKGMVELATAAETTAGTDNTRAVHPAGLKVELDKKANQTTTYTKTEVDAKVAAHNPPDASTTVKGIIQLATAAEVLAGTDALKAVTSKEARDHYIAKNITLLPVLP